MIQHLSIRIPWKDNGYNGLVCNKPCFNNSCLRLKNIASEKDDDYEDKLANKPIKGHEMEIPCLSEGGCFMANECYTRTLVHPYKESNPKTHGHFYETELNYPEFSLPARPFRWTMLSSIEERAKKYGIDYDPVREPDLRFNTNWVQDSVNQRAIFKAFYENVEINKSLVIPYAKQVPFTDDPKRVVMGVGYVTSMIEPPDHNCTDEGTLHSILWETMVGHSIRDDRHNGFLLPYREMMEYADEHPEFDINSITVFADDEYFDEFSYATEHVSYDAVISVLSQIIKSLEIIKGCIPGNWNECIQWTRDRLKEVWIERGVYPGFDSMLYAAGFVDNYYLIANKIKDLVEDESKFESKVEDILQNYQSYFSKDDQKLFNKTVIKYFLSLSDERKKLFWLLSRMSLTPDQACLIFLSENRIKFGLEFSDKDILENPYIIYEKTRLFETEYRISAKKVDMAVFPPEIIRDINDLQEPSALESGNDERRVRAYIVSQLEQEALNGHTVYPKEFIVTRINELPIEPECYVNNDIMGAIQDFLEGEMTVIDCEGGEAYQLNRLKEFDEIIRSSVKSKTEKDNKRHQIDEDWDLIVEEEFKKKKIPDFKERKLAKQERVDILKELAASRLSVLVGGAGTGKTTLLALLCKSPQIQNGGVLLLAPTGKARVRMTQAMHEHGVECKAKTVAQFLGESGRYDGYTMLYRLSNEEAENVPFTVIIDECSMLTEEMCGALFQALKKKAKRIILVGDPNQLPPIGAGRPFVDIVQKLGEGIEGFPRQGKGYGELTVNMRQFAGDGEVREDSELASWYTENPNDLNDDIFAQLQTGKLGDRVAFKKWDTPEDLRNKIFEVISDETNMSDVDDIEGFNISLGGVINNGWMNFGSNPTMIEDWQILSAYRNDAGIGTLTINRYIHDKYRFKDGLTMPNSKIRGTKYLLGVEGIMYGDKVINVINQKRSGYPKSPDNNYVANGEVGIVENLKYKNYEKNIKSNSHQVRFSSQPDCCYYWDSRVSEEGNTDLELAYALTVHKAQGSEFGVAILVISEPSRMLTKELLYTAITRQKNKLVILYNDDAVKLRDYSDMSSSEVARRFTCLFRTPEITEYKGRYYEKNLIHMTLKGDLVRSKSEVIIANMLYESGIDYEYEKEIDFGKDGKRIPDFTIMDEDGDVCCYWEHCGMLGDSGYSRHWEEKKKIYAKHNIIPGENLIVTEDSLNGAIDSKKIKEYIDQIQEEYY